ncbi:hypothetical protein [Streptomyces canus]|uniref:hypothetical protein n=1 Tax=Streptomyces canus TaxID=58343 RepID=UPI0027D7A742|nr:hypothetical protein [Streptomyces canus]
MPSEFVQVDPQRLQRIGPLDVGPDDAAGPQIQRHPQLAADPVGHFHPHQGERQQGANQWGALVAYAVRRDTDAVICRLRSHIS